MVPSLLHRFRKKTSVTRDPDFTVLDISQAPSPTQGKKRDFPHAHRLLTQRDSLLWPPIISSEAQTTLLNHIQDHQILCGSVIKCPVIPSHQQTQLPIAYPIGVSLFPTPYPQRLFQEAQELQDSYNELYCRLSMDESWLREATADLCKVDDFARTLWEIWDQVATIREERGHTRLGEEVSAAVWRSDYMLQSETNGEGTELVSLKQVEFNCLSCAGGLHSNRVSDIHRYLSRTGAYDFPESPKQPQRPAITPDIMPPNTTLKGIVSTLAKAHELYTTGRQGSEQPQYPTCILMLVQPNNINVADERPIEHALWNLTPPTPCFRLEFPRPILSTTSLSPSGTLIYTPPSHPHRSYEVSVIYYRAGHDVHEFFETPSTSASKSTIHSPGAHARIRLEASTAVKCPPLLGHITTLKRVQTALCAVGAVERFLSPERAAKVRGTFVPLYDMLSPEARAVVADEREVGNWILKPSLEGGGHGVFGEAIPEFLSRLKGGENEWGKYVLMRRIEPPRITGRLMSARGMYEGGVVSELGVFGGVLWKGCGSGHKRFSASNEGGVVDGDGDGRRDGGVRKASADGTEGNPGLLNVKILMSERIGWSLKTKSEDVQEMSVVKGYGCFDSPLLLDDETFRRISRSS